jgi:hypothetical protein
MTVDIRGWIQDRISELRLERYSLNEVTLWERKRIEKTLKTDPSLRERLDRLEESDRELRRIATERTLVQYYLPNENAGHDPENQKFRRNSVLFCRKRPLLWGLAAAALLCALFPAVYAAMGRQNASIGGIGLDRVKGIVFTDRAELSLYLNRAASGVLPLRDGAALQVGDMVQLAYRAPAGDEHYGVIFSIDGRSAVTMHYPYGPEQDPLLVRKKKTFLDEAYILDDAPDLEIFFMVVSENPLDTGEVLKIAERLALDPRTAPAESKTAFAGCDVEIIGIHKKQGE